ncbi:YggS family pyridoxal phosphate-dependent enzyme [Chryseobacterium sp. R2A-55]|uniref:YggS family pyridoxal phosphate-dependent enzyme n=1 Tax=Chryseobacterium sp. R2A-55 TaxID=2744445 RepID=UPI001F2DAD99|nr:YggS family pyridoxal phosphate-dependent enzyme [Chryseobacterium sp. R2A-55]
MEDPKKIEQNYRQIIELLPENVELVAVSKTHPVEVIRTVYDLGQKVFGENKVQELAEKYPLLPKDISWHLIGHLQRNKVKYIIEFIDTIQSVDSEKLLLEIDRQAKNCNRQVKVLLQVKIAEEESKFGLELHEAKEIFTDWLNGKYPNIEITGLMGMATFTENENQIKKEFNFLKQLYDQLSLKKNLKTLSMGMSGDYQLAIACGANSVRIGSAIFGNRDYIL